MPVIVFSKVRAMYWVELLPTPATDHFDVLGHDRLNSVDTSTGWLWVLAFSSAAARN